MCHLDSLTWEVLSKVLPLCQRGRQSRKSAHSARIFTSKPQLRNNPSVTKLISTVNVFQCGGLKTLNDVIVGCNLVLLLPLIGPLLWLRMFALISFVHPCDSACSCGIQCLLRNWTMSGTMWQDRPEGGCGEAGVVVSCSPRIV